MSLTYKIRLATQIISAADRFGLLNAYTFLKEQLAKLGGSTILYYHRVDEPRNYPWAFPPTRVQDFEAEIRYLCQKYKVISLNTLVQHIQEEKCLPPKTVVITMDEGFKDIYLNAYPILKKYNVSATIFLTTGRIDAGDLFWSDKVNYAVWNTTRETLKLDELGMYSIHTADQRKRATSIIKEKIRLMPNDKKNLLIEKLVSILGVDIPANLGKKFSLTWDEVRKMSKNGIAFGAHTVSHPILTKLPLEEAKREIVESKKHIEEELDKAVNAFAYPCGRSTDFNGDIKKIVKESGFACAVTTYYPSLFSLRRDIYELGRISPGPNAGIFKLYVSGLYPDLKAILRREMVNVCGNLFKDK